MPKNLQTLGNSPLRGEEIAKQTDERGIFALGCENDALHITYNKARRFSLNGQLFHLNDIDNKSVTILNFEAPYLVFDSNGGILNPNSVAFEGAWGSNRIAELLPLDYDDLANDFRTKLPIQREPKIDTGREITNKVFPLFVQENNNRQKNYPAEKLYLQTDKPNYAIGDTIWFKAYLFNAPTLALSAKSGIMYVRVANDSNTFIKQYRLPVKQGASWGNISLVNFPAGSYTLQAYTTWMRNFSSDCFFTKHFIVAQEKDDAASIINQTNLATTKRKANRTKEKQLKSALDIDVQFLPEGGSLIAGLPAHIGFKALGEDGKGINVSGTIWDNENRQVATFSSTHLGMGSFDLLVKPGARYKAKINLPGGITKEYPLPAIKNSGTVLSVVNPADKDSVTVFISATADIAKLGESYFLIGKARNVICYAAVFNFNNGDKVSRKIAKSLFPSGITHFLIMDLKRVPLNERLVFINHPDKLKIKLTTDKTVYAPHDSVATQITVIDAAGQPVVGNFSMAVTDNAQVNMDSLQDNIISHVLLTADLKGYIEEPGYYFQKNNPAWQALDNLLLTQGWVSYDLLAGKKQPAYAAEAIFAVKGKVVNGLQSPFKGAKVTLLSKSPFIVKDTLSDKNGRFSFTGFPQIDTPAFIVKAVNRHDKSFNVGIVMDDEQPPTFTSSLSNSILDTLVDTTLLVTAKNNRIRREQAYLAPDGHMLKEVKIKAQKIVKDSQNLNGPGNADFVLDEADLEKEGKKSWLDILYEKVKGFREGLFTATDIDKIQLWLLLHDSPPLPENSLGGIISAPWFFIEDKPIKIIVDGISLNQIYQHMSHDDIYSFLKSHNAEDIKGLEVNLSSRYSAKYVPMKYAFYVSASDIGFIEITTRSGNGLIIHNTPGVYLYKPLPLSLPKEFYKPRYTVNDAVKHQPDTRATIDWEPNVTTDENGKATVLFFTADKPATYTIIMEGCEGSGNLGYKLENVKVSNKK